ncbi:MAG TPA: HAMP domain-containing sensor histidine kinase [Actinomycetes bacterium]|nr:HAMP domain-containing sensor histidine kinase [Actinomycetes bacterium]
MTAPATVFGRLSMRSRVALLAAAAVGLGIAIASIAAYFTVSRQLYASRDANLTVRANAVASLFRNPDQIQGIPFDALRAVDVTLGLVNANGVVSMAEGQRIPPPVGSPEVDVARGLSPESIRTATSQGTEYRVVAVQARLGWALVLAQPTKDAEQLLDRLGVVLFLVGGLGMVAAATAGLAIARAGLRPVSDLTAAAERVATTDRLEPIEVHGHDELARLATSFNSMLAALAASRQRQQQLIADAGHELRTPLTSLRTNLDLLAQDDASQGRRLGTAERRELLADVRAQVEELTGLVQDVIELARDEPPQAHWEPLDFAEVCERAIDRVRRRSAELTFDVKLEPWPARGDATALERAVTNVLDNAAKWSPPGGVITVRLEDGELRVSDQGPGISEADLPYVFDRFYRASSARQLPGSGLGLAIVRQVADRHQATVSARQADGGGTLVVFRLPADPDLPPSSRVLGTFSASSQDAGQS